MNHITINNYEAFFLDYQEGKLNSEQLSELSLFLVLHPELKTALTNNGNLLLKSEKQTFKNKSVLKKFAFDDVQVNGTNFDSFCIAYQEHILSEEKSKELIEFCRNEPQSQKVFSDYQKIILKPQINVKFKNKKPLYRKSHQKPYYISIGLQTAALAAGIALLIGIYLSFKHESPQAAPILAVSQSQVHPEIKGVTPKMVDNKWNDIKLTKTKHPNLQSLDEIRNINLVTDKVLARETGPVVSVSYPKLQLLETNTSLSVLKEVKANIAKPGELNTEHNVLATTNNFINTVEEKITTINIFNKDKKKFLLLKIAKAGIWGLNKFTDSNMALTEKTDSIGNIMALSFESEFLEYHRTNHN
jgi:hypothetical protein